MPKVDYFNEEGKKCVSVTTVLGLINKPALVYSAWKLGTEGKDYKKEWDKKGSVGTLSHELIKHHFSGLPTNIDDYSKNIIDKAMGCFNSYLEWEKGVILVPLVVETPFVSKKLEVGATPDLFCLVNKIETLIDFKTGKDFTLYPENKLQILVYDYILEEFGYKSKQRLILKINTEEEKCMPFEISTKLKYLALKTFRGLKVAYDNLKYF